MITLTHDSAPARRGVGDCMVAERYDALVQWIRSSDNTTAVEAKTIGVTSCARGAGVSTVAANLAVAAAQNCDRPVLLLDLNGTRPLLAMHLSMPDDLRLRKALASDSRPGQFAIASPIPNLCLLAVNETGAPLRLSTDSRKLNDLLSELECDFGFIVVDLPPSDSGLCFAISGMLNGVLLVIEAQRTGGEAAVRATQRLIRAHATVLGVILNKYPRDLPNWVHARL